MLQEPRTACNPWASGAQQTPPQRGCWLELSSVKPAVTESSPCSMPHECTLPHALVCAGRMQAALGTRELLCCTSSQIFGQGPLCFNALPPLLLQDGVHL